MDRRNFLAGAAAILPGIGLIKSDKTGDESKPTLFTPSLRDQWFDDERITRHLKINLSARLGTFLLPPENRFKMIEYTGGCTYMSYTTFICQADINEGNLTDTLDNLYLAQDRLMLCLSPLREYLVRHIEILRQFEHSVDFKYSISNLRRFTYGLNHSIMFDIEIFRKLTNNRKVV